MSGFQSAYAFRENRGCVHREFSKHQYEFYIKVQFISHGKSFLQKKRFAKIRFERFREESFGESIFARRRRNCVFGWKFASKWVLLINLVSGFGRNNKKKNIRFIFLVSVTTDSPLYILSHSQAVLMSAIENDTQFLAAQTVMDYSLLVGLDEDRRELVIGIIGIEKNSIQSELAKIY